jgi:trans-2,3-dihydro-3-hydroxyanthranilate isomerase
MGREYRYVLLDVFTETPLLGNQLAVFLDGSGLSEDEMQALARETNLSETTFCFPGQGPGEGPGGDAAQAGVRVRIFTTEEELPFAGHPTLGTAAALRAVMPRLQGAAEVVLQLPVGRVRVRFGESQHRAAARQGVDDKLPFGIAVDGEMEQPLPVFGQVHEPAAVAAALGLPGDAIDHSKPIQTVSTGLPFVIVPLVSLGCATAWLVRHQYWPEGEPVRLEQGVEMGRRSVLRGVGRLRESEAAQAGHGAQGAWEAGSYIRVGGSTVLVAEGRFFLR